MKVNEFLFGLILGVAISSLLNFEYRNHFLRKLKEEDMDVQAQYKINRIQGLLHYYESDPAIPPAGLEKSSRVLLLGTPWG